MHPPSRASVCARFTRRRAVFPRNDAPRPTEGSEHAIASRPGRLAVTTRVDYSGTMASASISTSISGLMSRLTSTMLVAGRMSPNTSPCARPTASQSAMRVT